MNYNSVITYSEINYNTITLMIIIAILLIITDRLLLMIYDLKDKKFLEIVSPITYIIILIFMIQKFAIIEYSYIPKLEDAKEIDYFYTDKVVGIYYYNIAYENNEGIKRNVIKISTIGTYKVKYMDKEVILSDKIKDYSSSQLIDLTGYNKDKIELKIYDLKDNYIDNMEVYIKE